MKFHVSNLIMRILNGIWNKAKSVTQLQLRTKEKTYYFSHQIGIWPVYTPLCTNIKRKEADLLQYSQSDSASLTGPLYTTLCPQILVDICNDDSILMDRSTLTRHIIWLQTNSLSNCLWPRLQLCIYASVRPVILGYFKLPVLLPQTSMNTPFACIT